MFDSEYYLYEQLNSIKISDGDLPIAKYKNQIIETVRNNQIVIIFGDTGSGKTTQIPQYLFEANINNDKAIGVTQPRKIAAINMATRVAQEMNFRLGIEVGYEVRFNKKVSGSTKIKFMTDGMLLNYCLTDAKLSEYGVIMIDEAHERSVDSDVLLGLLKLIASARKDLKILITSATIDEEKFSKYFSRAPVISFEGKMYDVEIIYEPMYSWSIYFIKSMIEKIHYRSDEGDILVFLTGQEDIEECCDLLENVTNLVVLPLYGAMDFDNQQKVFKPVGNGKRKVIVATNIAETSITIDGIRFVVDCGYVKQNRFDAKFGIDTLQNVPISKNQAIQRRGRAGRTNIGWCYRLYSKETFESMKVEATPEIRRKNLCGTYLKLVSFGLDPMKFDFIDSPDIDTLKKCLEELQDLDLLDSNKRITELGKMMQDFPVEPKIGKVLLKSSEYSCSLDVITILAMLTERNVFIRPKKFRGQSDSVKKQFFSEDGDQFMLLNVFTKWMENNKSKQWCYDNFVNLKTMEEIDLVRTQLLDLMKRKFPDQQMKSNYVSISSIKKCLISGFYKNICYQKSKGVYINYSSKQVLYMHPSSCLMNKHPLTILYNEVVHTNKPYMRGIISLTDTLLSEFPREMRKIEYFQKLRISRDFMSQLYDLY